jgi:hypothetical protein
VINNRSLLGNILKLTLKEFNYHQPYGPISHRFISSKNAQDQFEVFAVKLIESLGRKFLPIYRMADGEFSILINAIPSMLGAKISLRQRVSEYKRYFIQKSNVSPFETCWGEKYTPSELKSIRTQMAVGVKSIARDGILAPSFAVRQDLWGAQYFHPMCAWFDDKNIQLSCDNYIPFYFVYAILSGPYRKLLFDKSKVLVVTGLTPSRKKMIHRGLLEEGASDIEFYDISASNSMHEIIDLNKINRSPDLILVAAGIGSVNILQQFKQVAVPTIDCGIILDCYTDSSHRYNRAFLLDDQRLQNDEVYPGISAK